ncbi:MAG: TetR family transcriptional regulator [Limibacillus sp.]|jgi:AcrR family transcriptional regulator
MATAKGGGRKKSAKPRDPEKTLIDAAMKLAAEKGWKALSLAEIGEEAGLEMKELFVIAPGKQAILDLLGRRIDAEVLAEGPLDEAEGSPRDRLFDVLMRRFDAMAPYKEGIGEITYDLGRSPLDGLAELPSLKRSMAWMLEASGIDSSGLKGMLRVKVLTGIYLGALRSWLKDDTADFSKTMAALDSYLRRLEPWAERFERRGRGRRDHGDETETATDNS